ncbi:MAG: efflux RND transporter permease subunit [Gammaproteobacteria bacterium]|nr:efflux RND transporter permease subunit [Gammaproteobacteria bacterium]
MFLSDLSVKRPVFAGVLNLLIVVFGVIAFTKLPLREYPDINPPVVSVDTNYPGASAAIVESKITQLLEDQVSGLEGVVSLESASSDGRSRLTIEFDTGRSIDAAANDVRDRISRALDNLPEEATPPEISKVDSNSDPILWLNLASDSLDSLGLTDYANRYLVDRLGAIDGVAFVRVGGAREYAMRIWLDRAALAARQLTVADVETALRRENVELPAGRVESEKRVFSVRVPRAYNKAEDFARLVVKRGEDGYLVRLADVARVELGARDERNELRGNGQPMIGLGIVKTSTANTLEVARRVKAEAARIGGNLPDGTQLILSFDSSVFIEGAVHEVYRTLGLTIALVIGIIYLFLGSARATLIPALTVPVSLIGACTVLWLAGFSINLLTLLALILAIGLVVDDAIVVLENVHRHIERGETPLVAAWRGTREVGFAVLATTLVLMAVFVPIAFLEGNTGRLFTEFALGLAAAVGLSLIVALTLSPMMCSKLLKAHGGHKGLAAWSERSFARLERGFGRSLDHALKHPLLMVLALAGVCALIAGLFRAVPAELAPREDRGSLFINIDAPEGTSYAEMRAKMRQVEAVVLPYAQSVQNPDGELTRVNTRIPRGFGGGEAYNTGSMSVMLKPWEQRRPIWELVRELNDKLNAIPGIRANAVVRQGLGGGRGGGQPVQFVLQGATYEELSAWRDIVKAKTEALPGLVGLDDDYKETKPELKLVIDKNRAADLGVPLDVIGRTLETLLGSRRVTTFADRGEEYDVVLEGEPSGKREPADLGNVYVRSETSKALIPLANLVSWTEGGGVASLNRYNRLRAITFSAGLADGYSLGQALDDLQDLVAAELPPEARIDFKGQSLEYKRSSGSMGFLFGMALLIVYLVLAAQFENLVHPFVILLTVPLALAGALLGLWVGGQTLNIYSQIGIVMLLGLAAKNGILIVEFANQLRDGGLPFLEALRRAATQRLRPILMTSFTAVVGALPLIFASGPGAESRVTLGVVVFAGVLVATLFTLYVVPVAYELAARRSGSPEAVARELEKQLGEKG